jgi:comEA protein
MAPWRISLGAICFVLLALSQKKRRVIVLVIALTLGSVVMSMRQQSLESSAVANFFQSTVEVRAQITTDPQRTKAKVTGPISLNRASAKELESLDGIGPVLAARIVAYRKINGPFLTVEDLLKVSGIGTAKYGQFKEKLRV